MKQSRMELLRTIYERENSGENTVCIFLDKVDNPKELIEDSNQLIEDGYLVERVKITKQLNLKLTDMGWDFIENGFKNGGDTVSVNGDNNIVINGNSNTVSDNFNNIKVEISESDLSDEQKQQIIDLLDEIKAAQLSGDDVKGKIRGIVKSFVLNIGSNIAAAPIIEFISAVCSNI